VEALDCNCVELRKVRTADLGSRMYVAVGKVDLVVLSQGIPDTEELLVDHKSQEHCQIVTVRQG